MVFMLSVRISCKNHHVSSKRIDGMTIHGTWEMLWSMESASF